MVSKKIKYARAHLTRRKHLAILARPIWRRCYFSPDSNCLPRPYSVARAALRARASKRIKLMAQPKSIQRKFDRSHSRVSLQYPRERQEGELREPSARIFDLSLPKKSRLLYARRMARNDATVAFINSLLQDLRKSKYQKYRVICETLRQRAAAREKKIRRKLRKTGQKQVDWKRLATPKGLRSAKSSKPATAGSKRKKKTLFSVVAMDRLSQQSRKPQPTPRNPFKVAKSALIGPVSERILHLAQVEPRPEPAYRVPGQVVSTALKAVASERIVELAKPATHSPGLQTDLKEDAFSVLPRALKAVCRPRVKALALPKKRSRRGK